MIRAMMGLAAFAAGASGCEPPQTGQDAHGEPVEQIEQAVLSSARNAPFGYRRSDGIVSVVSLGQDNRIHELAWIPGNGWNGPFDLNAVASGSPPNGTGSPAAYLVGSMGGVIENVVLYRASSSGDIIEIFAAQGQSWSSRNLMTQASGSSPPPAASDPAGFQRGGGQTGNSRGTRSIVYRSTSNDIIELNDCGGWNAVNLTTLTGSLKAKDAPKPYIKFPSIPAVVFRNANNDIVEYTYYDGGWDNRNLSNAAPGAVQAARTEPMGYVRSDNNTNAVVFAGTNSHVIELGQTFGNGWVATDLTAATGAPLVEGRPWGYSRHDGISSVVYRGQDDRIREIARVGNNWFAYDLMGTAGATVLAASSPRAFKNSNLWSSVIYRGTDNRLYEMRLDNSGWHTLRVF